MNTIKLLGLLFLLIITRKVKCQDEKHRLILLDFHVGTGASNLFNAEAPHKLLSLDDYFSPVSASESELNYQTRFLNDIKYSFVGGVSLEYYLKPGLSLLAKLNFETKGLAMDYMYEELHLNTEPMWIIQEDYSYDISNHYLTLPLALRKYINTKNTFYLQGGLYMAYLLQSSVDVNITGVSGQSFSSSELSIISTDEPNTLYEISLNEDDFEKELTSQFDFGVIMGTGVNYPITDKFYFNADLSVCIGLKNIDGVYDNEYSEANVPTTTGYSSNIRSTNYYGLNSRAKNISAALTVGVGLRL